MYFVHLLESNRLQKWYVGYTPAWVYDRVKKHNAGLVLSTKAYLPWKLIYFEAYINRSDALGREKFLKSGAGRKFLTKQVKYYLLVHRVRTQ